MSPEVSLRSTQTQTRRAYPHVTLAVDDEQHGGAEPDEVLPPQSKLFSVVEKMDYSDAVREQKKGMEQFGLTFNCNVNRCN